MTYNINYPITYSKEILPNSLDERHLRSFIECFQNVEYVQYFTMVNAANIIQSIESDAYRLNSGEFVEAEWLVYHLYTESAIKYIESEEVLKQLIKNPVIEEIIENLSETSITEPDYSMLSDSSHMLVETTAGGAGGVVAEELLKYVGPFILLSFLTYIFNRTNIHVVTRDISTIDEDNRRLLVNITLFLSDNSVQNFALKLSCNQNMIPHYQYEEQIYIKFEDNDTEDILPFYGSSNNRSVRNSQDNKIYLEINISNDKLPSFILEVTKIDNFYCFAMESLTRTRFNELGFYLKRPRFNANINYMLKAIMDSVSNLNRNFGFFHGDLKYDNVMIHENDNSVLNFDFDFSGFVNIPDKNVTINKYPIKFNSRTPPNFYHPTTEEGFIRLSNILYFYDIYRLLISVYMKKRFTFNSEIYSNITVNNDSIHINLGEIIRYLGTYLSRDVEASPSAIPYENVENAIIKIKNTFNIRGNLNWNNTICSVKIVMLVYNKVAKDIIL